MSPQDLMPGGTAAPAVALAVGVANFLAILAVLRALSPKDLVRERARSHARRRNDLRAALLQPRRGARPRSVGLARRLVELLKLNRDGRAGGAAALLVQAGWRSPDAMHVFLALKVLAPLALAAAAWLLAPGVLHDDDPLRRLAATLGGAVAGLYLPRLMLKNAIQKRSLKIQRALPDALDLFVICAEAGLSLDAALARVSREIGPAAPELADELGLTAVELGFLPDRREALLNLTRRVAAPQVRGLVNTLVQTEKYGTPLAQALRVLAAEFRDTRMMKAEEKAARLPATLTVPMIAFILPPLFVVLIGPAIVQVLTTSFR
ncbi:Flp pilus assembly protein TadC [Phenylobacterium zucineum HLK1]|uniref:Flp pilus assembly protein TadC n=1 Tax=Phenylobacterium zucineum (strain HLK1) TaxID=450851 RepID=B4R9F1_PHEZH|nr:type II secretion system F family protein [Phenylobacterium zucineum]ACG79411.1 Flp pilus assembly protein TadC [Phenylobacterium zucineum HLK1]